MKGNRWRTSQVKQKMKDLDCNKRELRVNYTEKDREAKRSIKAEERKWMENIARKKEDQRPRESQERTKGEVYREAQGGEEEYKGR